MATSALCAVLLAVAMATATASDLTRSEYRDCRDAGGSPEDQLDCMEVNVNALYCDSDPLISDFLNSDLSQHMCVIGCRSACTAGSGHTGGLSGAAGPFVCPPLCQYIRAFTEENRPDCGGLTDADNYDPSGFNYQVGPLSKRIARLEALLLQKLEHSKRGGQTSTDYFNALDKDFNGELTPAETRAGVPPMPDQIFNAQFRKADTNGNGTLNQAEYDAWIEANGGDTGKGKRRSLA